MCLQACAIGKLSFWYAFFSSEQHCSSGNGNARSMILVTASVDRIIMKRPIRVDADLSIVGAVTWVGRSSMEMQLQVIQTQGIQFLCT